jgi:lipopolysaccharide transport protein LptA
MDSSILKHWRAVVGFTLLAFATALLAADPLPISLDAESSSFDRQSNTMVFRRLNITQGDMVIRADEAVASGLDFEQGEWRFNGNVQFTVDKARIQADTATLIFAANELQSAELVGAPATFEQVGQIDADTNPFRGRATRLSFDNVDRFMRLLGGAWFSQGPNEFRGCDLIYDLDQEQITSGSSDCGEPVVITIVPRSGEDQSESSTSP